MTRPAPLLQGRRALPVWVGPAVLAVGLCAPSPARASDAITAQPLPPPGALAPGITAQASGPRNASAQGSQRIGACLDAAASAYRIPPVVLFILLHVEGGQLGSVHHNTNGTVDIGPMQINQIWLPSLARHWHASIPATYAALETDFCANVTAGSWILHRAIDEAHGHLWGGVAYYHSHTLAFETDYLRAVLREVRHLQAEIRLREREGS